MTIEHKEFWTPAEAEQLPLRVRQALAHEASGFVIAMANEEDTAWFAVYDKMKMITYAAIRSFPEEPVWRAVITVNQPAEVPPADALL